MNAISSRLTINHLAVWLVAIAQQVIGVGWYGLFRNRWLQLIAKQAADFEGQSFGPYLFAFAGAVATCYITAWIFTKLNIDTALQGVVVASLLWLGFTFVPIVQNDLFPLRPIELSFINSGYSLVSAIVCGATLGAWRKYDEQ